jgi:RNA polymerase sigma-70 factor (ECF subfamily)
MREPGAAELILRCRSLMFGYIMAHTGDYDAAEDLFQESCRTIVEKFGSFEPGTDFRAWSMRIVRNKVLSHYRDAARGRTVRLSEELADSLADEPRLAEEPRPWHADLVALRACLERLKGRSREIVLRRYGEGLPPRRIAGLLRLSRNAVYVALSRVRAFLERCVRARLAADEGGGLR